MTDKHTDLNDFEEAELQAFFEAASAKTEAPGDALMSAILADADALQPDPHAIKVRRGAFSWSRDVWQVLGGWRGVSALTASVVLGLWVGYAPPAGLSTFTEALLGTDTATASSDVFFSLDDLLVES